MKISFPTFVNNIYDSLTCENTWTQFFCFGCSCWHCFLALTMVLVSLVSTDTEMGWATVSTVCWRWSQCLVSLVSTEMAWCYYRYCLLALIIVSCFPCFHRHRDRVRLLSALFSGTDHSVLFLLFPQTQIWGGATMAWPTHRVTVMVILLCALSSLTTDVSHQPASLYYGFMDIGGHIVITLIMSSWW